MRSLRAVATLHDHNQTGFSNANVLRLTAELYTRNLQSKHDITINIELKNCIYEIRLVKVHHASLAGSGTKKSRRYISFQGFFTYFCSVGLFILNMRFNWKSIIPRTFWDQEQKNPSKNLITRSLYKKLIRAWSWSNLEIEIQSEKRWYVDLYFLFILIFIFTKKHNSDPILRSRCNPKISGSLVSFFIHLDFQSCSKAWSWSNPLIQMHSKNIWYIDFIFYLSWPSELPKGLIWIQPWRPDCIQKILYIYFIFIYLDHQVSTSSWPSGFPKLLILT